MPALDTNVLVRYVVRDDAAQLAVARELIRRCVGREQTLFVTATVLLELEWVLRSAYGFAKDQVIHVVAALLSAAELRFESEQALEVALQLYREGVAGFADCIHVALAADAGEQPMWTFDRRAARVPGARLLSRRP
ncbi:MAG: type II toxin-antitoxin system VapC family toxin [Burkholderiales bacterium]|nr:type II toxin-antitoxin system VapC family toxin [Burkholderiales bacterium]